MITDKLINFKHEEKATKAARKKTKQKRTNCLQRSETSSLQAKSLRAVKTLWMTHSHLKLSAGTQNTDTTSRVWWVSATRNFQWVFPKVYVRFPCRSRKRQQAQPRNNALHEAVAGTDTSVYFTANAEKVLMKVFWYLLRLLRENPTLAEPWC